MLVNTDNAINNPEPLQPNMIQVGGLQINEPKPLPKVIDEIRFQFILIAFFFSRR